MPSSNIVLISNLKWSLNATSQSEYISLVNSLECEFRWLRIFLVTDPSWEPRTVPAGTQLVQWMQWANISHFLLFPRPQTLSLQFPPSCWPCYLFHWENRINQRTSTYSRNEGDHSPCNLTHVCSFPLVTKDSLSRLRSQADSSNCILYPHPACRLKTQLLQLTLLPPTSSVFPLNWIIPVSIQTSFGEKQSSALVCAWVLTTCI